MELARKYRPKSFKTFVGNEQVIQTLESMLKKGNVPHAILFNGPSGCGKTTLARIVAKELGCESTDYKEINAADSRGIDTIRDIRSRMGLAGFKGGTRVYVIDEAHKLTNDAQNALLKPLEEPPDHVYIFLCTTEPTKLIKTVVNRCTEIKVNPLWDREMVRLISQICDKEGIKLPEEAILKLEEVSEGAARKALVILDQVKDLDKEDMLEAIQKSESKRQAIELARLLMRFKPKPTWKEVAALVKQIEDDSEGIRRMVMAYCSTVCLGGGPLAARAALVMNSFRDPFYEYGNKPLLVLACWESVQSG